MAKSISWRGVNDAKIQVYPASGTWTDILNVVSVTASPTVTKVEQRGDDAKVRDWYHSPAGTLTIACSSINDDLIVMTQNDPERTISSQQYGFYNTNKSLTPQTVSLQWTINAYDEATGATTPVVFYCPKATASNPQPLNFNEAVGSFEYQFDMASSANLVNGNALPGGLTKIMFYHVIG